jgi:hypothetical protein
MQVNGEGQRDTQQNDNQTAELSLREEIVRNLADLKGEIDDQTGSTQTNATTTPAADIPASADPAASTATKAAIDPAAPAATTPETPKSKAPQSWPAADRAHWDKIPVDVQAVIARREEEAHKGITQLGQDASYGKQIKEVIAPYLPIIRAEGGTEAGAVRDLLQTAYVLRTANAEQKVGLFRQLAGQFGVDLNAVTAGAPQVDPQVQSLQRELAQVKGFLHQGQQQQHQQVQDQVQSVIDSFAADPKNEFYEQVKPLMGSLLVNGQARDMQEAYDMACHANPDVRSTILTRQTVEADAKRAAEANAKAAAKRRASGSVNGSPGAPVTATTTAQNLSLRDELQANFRAATAS